ncbi:acyltransferase family protein [Pseudonocardia sp. HH130630-07]|uniref:acyltransferase family protein n=1 Tax=Pseudonocardia sp. HH130630-07 TaxID=1690815 RepID=UPI00081510F8|nr:acyltransferase family protein [Pseudonocardia sp. HH130630-07]ANY05882.1 acyltransferase [Pseudonocardia sp. HH130630-07]
MTSTGGTGPIRTAAARQARFRPELQGLRALAVVLVVVYHVWVGRVSGGVDVFFLITGFLIIGGLYRAGLRGRVDLHARLSTALLVLGGSSLAFSVYLTVVNQPLAYFHSLTRVWEFALGGLLALWIGRIEHRPELTPAVRAGLGWFGVLALVSCGVLLQVDRAFPGWAALWPTLAAAAVLVAGDSGHQMGVDRLLRGPVLRTVGDLSFPLYLWHWPILVLTLVHTGSDRLSLTAGTLVIGASFVLAWLTHRFVEQPIARLDVRRALRTCGVLALVVLVGSAGWFGVATARASVQADAGSASHPGAGALTADVGFADLSATDPEPELTPSLVGAPDDWSYHRGTWDCGTVPRDGVEMQHCTIPPPGDGPPERTIAVIGDSHIQQYIASLMPVAAQRHWEIVALFRGACPFSTVSETDPADEDCTAFNAAAAAEVIDLQPDALLTLATREVRPGLTEVTPQGFVDAWWRMQDAGIPVVAVRDNPRPPFSVPECVGTEGRHAEACGLSRHDVYPMLPPYAALPDVPPDVSFIDTAPAICDPELCPAEVGNVLVYMDDNHLTATYAETMAPLFSEHFEHQLGW